jgi:UDP-N-acetylglucosamine transferase subunit ALG13
MIFVTVGTDLPFDRMVRVVDQWAADTGRTDIFAQIGDTEWRPRFMPCSRFLTPAAFAQRFASASTIVSHAGMGTILSALRYEKPILVMPRQAALGEQRNEHQLATARRLSEMGKISVAFDETSLRLQLEQLNLLQVRPAIGAFASAELLFTIRQFIGSDRQASVAGAARPSGTSRGRLDA